MLTIAAYVKADKRTVLSISYASVLVTVLQAVAELRKSGLEMNFSFLNYAQSSECRNWQDSSVSYAAGALIAH